MKKSILLSLLLSTTAMSAPGYAVTEGQEQTSDKRKRDENNENEREDAPKKQRAELTEKRENNLSSELKDTNFSVYMRLEEAKILSKFEENKNTTLKHYLTIATDSDSEPVAYF